MSENTSSTSLEEDNIYILQLYTGTAPAKIIKRLTHYPYSHIALSFTKDCTTTYSFGRKSLHNILNSGFVVEEKNGKFFKKFNKTICRVYEIHVEHEKYLELKKIISDMIDNKSKYGYDFVGIILRYFGVPVYFKNKYVCSYFVANVLDKSGICHFNKKVFFITPKDFEKISNGKIIYEGKYLDM